MGEVAGLGLLVAGEDQYQHLPKTGNFQGLVGMSWSGRSHLSQECVE
jgi:hypothetical protein